MMLYLLYQLVQALFPAFDANVTTYKVLLFIGTASVTPTATKMMQKQL
jgi:hypothetical protein